MVNSSIFSQIMGYCLVGLQIKQNSYNDIKLLEMYDLCCHNILSHDFLSQYFGVKIHYGGPNLPLNICGQAAVDTPLSSISLQISSHQI